MISLLRESIEVLAKDNSFRLRIGGLFITTTVVSISVLFGWSLEQIALDKYSSYNLIGSLILIFSMASCIATKSLRASIFAILKDLEALPESISIKTARKNLSHIVGRDVSQLNRSEILRATAETASENSIDGIFAPLFWMFIGASLLTINSQLPGPLALGLAYKASSTIDSMIGYKTGPLLYLGMVGAKLDDALTWLPCRIVLITLPLISKPFYKVPSIIKLALNDGSKDPSPNSGISEAIFAHCLGIKMGGLNYYKGKLINKPILAKESDSASPESIRNLLRLSLRLELIWLICISIIAFVFAII